MLIELHAHTARHSPCSAVDPVDLVRGVMARGLNGLLITEHHYLWSESELSELARAAGCPGDFVLLAAQEIETDAGHALLIGADSTVAKPVSVARARGLFPEAVLVLAHPFRSGRQPDEKLLRPGMFDAVEIISGNHSPAENYRALAAWHDLRFTATAGSDVHSADRAGTCPTEFLHPVRTVRKLAAEIRAGRCHPLVREVHHHGSTLTAVEVIIGVKGSDESRGRFIVKRYAEAAAWRQARSAAAFLRAVRAAGFADGPTRVPAVHEIDDGAQMTIEEGQRGRTLFDILSTVGPSAGRASFERASRWLARFHEAAIPPSSAGVACDSEITRVARYAAAVLPAGSHASRVIAHAVRYYQERISSVLSADGARLVEAHGDYHPKNIIAGRDLTHDGATEFIAVIDFASVKRMPREFDIGYFIAQMSSMFHDRPDVTGACPRAAFVDAYRAAAGPAVALDAGLISLFELRGMLSIANYLYRLGLGTSELFVSTCARIGSLSDFRETKTNLR